MSFFAIDFPPMTPIHQFNDQAILYLATAWEDFSILAYQISPIYLVAGIVYLVSLEIKDKIQESRNYRLSNKN